MNPNELLYIRLSEIKGKKYKYSKTTFLMDKIVSGQITSLLLTVQIKFDTI